MGRRYHYYVYVIELSKDVLYEARFKKANPDYVTGKPCVYVGMTGLNPDVRFDKHKAGIQSNRFVQLFGLRLLPELYEVYNPMPYDAARDMEVELAIGLCGANDALTDQIGHDFLRILAEHSHVFFFFGTPSLNDRAVILLDHLRVAHAQSRVLLQPRFDGAIRDCFGMELRIDPGVQSDLE